MMPWWRGFKVSNYEMIFVVPVADAGSLGYDQEGGRTSL